MAKIAKNKMFTGFVVLTTIFWAVGIVGILTPLFPASAAVTVVTESRITGTSEMFNGGMTRDVAAFKITANSSETLNSIKIRFSDVNSSGATPATMLAAFNATGAGGANVNQGLSVWKDNNSNGWIEFSGTSADTALAWQVQPTWVDAGSGNFDATLDFVDDALSASYAGSWNYFIVMKISTAPAAAKTFKLTFPGGAAGTIVTSANSPTITALNTGALVSMGSTGSHMSPPHVTSTNYLDYKTLSVVFDMALDPVSATCNEGVTPGSCTSKYTLKTAATDTETITSATMTNGDTTIILNADNAARISLRPEDTIKISNDPVSAVRAVGGAFFMDSWPLVPQGAMPSIKISEIKLADGISATNEYIELYNSSNASVNLATGPYKVKALRNNVEVTLATLSGTVAVGKYFLLANTANNYHLNVNGASMAADAVFAGVDLQAGDTIMVTKIVNGIDVVQDMVGIANTAKVFEMYFSSTPNTGDVLERKANWSSTATSMMTGADLASGNIYDSNDNNYDFVTHAATPQNASSTAEVPQVVSNTPPTITFTPVVSAVSGNELKIPAKIEDTDSASQLTTKLCYKASNVSWPGSPTCVDGLKFTDFMFTIPASAVTAAGIDYYLYATDSASVTTYSSGTSAATAQQSPFQINVSAISGSRQISGTVYQSNCTTPIANATVKVEGTGYSAIANGSGVFTINSIHDGVYNLKATVGGYSDSILWGVGVNMNNPVSSGWNFCMTAAAGSKDGSYGEYMVSYSAPMDGMDGAPKDIGLAATPIMIGLNFSAAPASITTSSVLLKKITGGVTSTVAGYSVGADIGAGVGGRNFGGTGSKTVIVVYNSTVLDSQTQYVVEVLPSVTTLGGQPISGSRPGGGHMISFSASSTGSTSFGGGSGFQFSESESMWTTNNFTSMNSDVAFVEMKSKYNTATGKWDGGQYNPPYIYGTTPTPGSLTVPLNLQNIILKFSEPLDGATVNKGTIQLATVNATTGIETDVTATKVSSVTFDSSKTFILVNINGALSASTTYRVKVKNGVRSVAGITLGPPNDPGATFYKSDFVTATANDSTTPAISNTYPANAATSVPMDFGFVSIDLSEAVNPTSVNSSSVFLKAGQSVVPSTVEYDPMSQRINIFPNTGMIPGTKYTIEVDYGTGAVQDLSGNPSVTSAEQKVFTMTTTADSTKPKVEFVNCDNYSCAVTFSKSMNANKSSSSSANSTLWSKSVLNPLNYALTFGPSGTGTSVNLGLGSVSFTYKPESNTVMIEGLTFTGATPGTDSFVMTITGVQDLMSNPIDTTSSANIGKGKLNDKSNTMGFIGPGTGGSMMGGGGGMGVSTGGPSGFGSFKVSEAMMGGAMVMPMSMLAGKSTTYIFDIPKLPGKTADKLDDGSYIKLTFEKGKGFDLTNAEPDTNNPAKNDLNFDGPSTVKLKTNASGDTSSDSTKGAAANDGIVVSSANTLIAYLDTGGGTTGAPDRFHLEIKGIINPTVTQSLTSSGYTIDEKLYKADGTLVDTISSMPFFINPAGGNTIIVNVTAADGNGTFKLMMGSPLSGPMDSTVTVASGTATQTWGSLPNGCYHIFTEPTITLGANKYSGQMNPEPICLPGTGAFWNSGTSTYTKPLLFTKYGAGNSAQLSVKVSGTFKAIGEDIDIFAGGPKGFAVETKTLTGAVTNNSTTVYLPSDGNYMVGIGPAMPKGPMMGPTPMSDWMPPRSINIEVSGVGGTPVIKRTDTGATITELSFNVNAASKLIIGRLISKETILTADYTANATSITVASASGFSAGDYIAITNGTASAAKISSISGTTINLTSGVSTAYTAGAKVYNVVPDTNIWANQPMGFGGAGSSANTNTDGTFTLKISNIGNYEVGAWKSGMGEAPMRSVTVKDNTGASDGNATADIYNDGTIVTASAELLLKMFRPDFTISGKVMDASSNPIQYMHVMAQESTTKQTAHADTNSSGDYILNVSPGNWVVSGSMPQSTDACGVLTKTVPVSEATGSPTFQNITPSTSTCYTIAGTITLNGVVQENIPVMINAWDTTNDRPLGTYFRNEMTDTAGGYKVKVGNGTYRLELFSPDFGQIGQSVIVNGADATSNISYSAGAMKTMTLIFTGGTASMRGFVDIKSTTTANRRGVPLTSLAATQTITLPADIYQVKAFVEGLGDFSPASNVDMSSANQTVTLNISGQQSAAVSGTILDASNNPVANSVVILANTSDGTTIQTTTDSNGDYSATVKKGDYNISAGNKDYSSPAKASISVQADVNYDFDTNITDESVAAVNALVEKTLTITGTIYKEDASTPVSKGYVFASTSDGKKTKAAIQGDGTYSMSVSAGTWTVKADAPLYSETTRSATVEVSSTSATGKNVTLTANSNDVKKSDSTTVSPVSGVSIDDSDNTGIEFIAGQGVMGRATSATISMEEVDMPTIDMGTPVGAFVDITANASGTDINQLTGTGAEIIIPYTAAEMTTAGATNESAIVPAYYDETTATYVPFSNYTCDRTANTCTATTTHLTSIGVIAVPLTAAGRRSTETPSTGAVVTAPVTAEPVTKVETKVETKKEAKKVETKIEVKETKTLVKETVKEAAKAVVQKVVALTNVLPVLPQERVLAKEAGAVKDASKLMGKAPSTEKDWKVVNYLAYGTTDKVKAMPTTERKSLLEDYKKIYNKIPSSEKEWTDVAKIAEGVTPSRVLSQEVQAIKTFINVFGRVVDFKNASDEKFIHNVAYNLRPETRDLAKEKAAIAQVQKTLKKTPNSSELWAVVHAIAYSGIEAKKVSVPAVEKKSADKQVSEALKPVETIANAVPTQPVAAERNLKSELSATADYTKISGQAPSGDGWKVVQFISYGSTDDSKDKTSAERVKIVKQYKSKYGSLPANDADWQKLAQLVK